MKRALHLLACVQTGAVALSTTSLAVSVAALAFALVLLTTARRPRM